MRMSSSSDSTELPGRALHAHRRRVGGQARARPGTQGASRPACKAPPGNEARCSARQVTWATSLPVQGPRPAFPLPTHRNLSSGSGRKRLFIELARSTRTRTGTADGRSCSGDGGGPRFHTTSTSPARQAGRGAGLGAWEAR